MTRSSNVVDLHGLKLVILPGTGVPAAAQKHYSALYEAWKLNWRKTLFELDGSEKLFSDNFTRQDYHLAIFHGSRCVTSISFRRINLQSPADLEDSWLKIWPKEILDSYAANFRRGMMTSWFFVDPDYRRSQAENQLSRLQVSNRITEMISYFVLDLDAEVTLGGVRNNRSVNTLVATTGCNVVMPNVMNHGVAVDLITWLPLNARVAIEKYSRVTHDLWNNRTVFESEVLRASQPINKKIKAA